MVYEIKFTREASKDVKTLSLKLKQKLKDIVKNSSASDPYSGKKLVGDLSGFYSYRLSFKDRIVCSIDEQGKIVYIHRAKTHYGD